VFFEPSQQIVIIKYDEMYKQYKCLSVCLLSICPSFKTLSVFNLCIDILCISRKKVQLICIVPQSKTFVYINPNSGTDFKLTMNSQFNSAQCKTLKHESLSINWLISLRAAETQRFPSMCCCQEPLQRYKKSLGVAGM